MTVHYKDGWVKVVGSIVLSHFVLMIGQYSGLESFNVTAFYTDSMVIAIIAFLVWEMLSRVIKYLDSRLDWMRKPFERALSQLIFGIILPVLLVFILIYLQSRLVFNQGLWENQTHTYTFPVAIAMIVLVNVFYISYYFVHRLGITD